MPARFSDLKRWAERRGGTVREPSSGSHWKIFFEDGWVIGITGHNALKSEIKDGYLRDIAKHFGMTLAELLKEL